MLNFASQELDEGRESNNYYEFSPSVAAEKSRIKIDSVKIFADKLCVPAAAAHVERPRLLNHLEKSVTQFSATLIAGRAGTGKTSLAADFARDGGDYRVAWYKVETADSDWRVFSSYLAASLRQFCPDAPPSPNISVETGGYAEVAAETEFLAAQISNAADAKPLLIVLDDLHSVFDAVWFAEFFNSFVASLAPDIHLLLTARTLPPLPLWRLRSKQVLGITDEKLLAFTPDETIKLFGRHKLSPSVARSAHKLAYGKIAKLEEIINKKSWKPNRPSKIFV